MLDEKLSEYYNALQELIDQLEKRLANISHPVEFLSDKNCDNDIEEALNRLNLVLNENNSFSQIYKVSQCVAVTDDNYDMLYSFGNSARKFLEMYLYFKYPTDEDLLPKLKRFFDPEDVPPILINRLLNEDSHGPTPENSLRTGIDPETIPVAKKILQLLQKDSEQYSAFMESIS